MEKQREHAFDFGCSMNRDQLKKLEGDFRSAVDKLRANSDLPEDSYDKELFVAKRDQII